MASVSNLESQSLARALDIIHKRFQELGLPFAFCGDVAYKIYNKTANLPEILFVEGTPNDTVGIHVISRR